MAISFEEKSLKYFRRLCQASLCHEETMEIIVPDNMPDAAAVIDADGVALLRGKEALNGRFSVDGTTEAYVIYRAEDGSGPRRLNMQIPFAAAGECPGLTDMGRLVAACRLVSAEARIINSRKLLVKTEVCVDAAAFVQEQMKYLSKAAGDCGDMQLLEKNAELCLVADVTEKAFSIGEDFALPSSKPPIGTILKTRLRLTEEEASALGGRLIIKGNACVAVVYASASGGEPACAEFKIPYSALLEFDWNDEGLSFDTAVMPTGLSLTESSGGKLSIEIGAVAQAAVWRKCGICYIADAYSTEYETELQTENVSLELLDEKNVRSETLRLAAEAPVQPRAIIDASAYIGKLRTEDGIIKAPVFAKALCVGEDDSLFAATAKGEAAKSAEQGLSCFSAELGELYATPSASGAEIRVPVSYGFRRYKSGGLTLAVSASAKSDSPRSRAEQPSITVFRASESDSLWEIGKRYATTRELLRKINGLAEDGEINAGDLVLVARQR